MILCKIAIWIKLTKVFLIHWRKQIYKIISFNRRISIFCYNFMCKETPKSIGKFTYFRVSNSRKVRRFAATLFRQLCAYFASGNLEPTVTNPQLSATNQCLSYIRIFHWTTLAFRTTFFRGNAVALFPWKTISFIFSENL